MFCSQVTWANFLQMDLGAGMSIGSVIVRHAQAGGESASFNTRDCDIQVSNEGANFTTVAQVRGNTAAATTTAVTATGRFVRLNVVTGEQAGTTARIYEMEVYA
jgi:hypothetical protein